MKHLKLLPLLIAAAFCVPRAHAIDLIAVGTLSGSMGDLSSATSGLLENGVAGNLLGGLGSGFAYAGGNTFIATPDRGPNAVSYNSNVDDTTSYINRFQTVNMVLSANSTPGPGGLPFTLTPTLTSTTLMSSATPLVYGAGAAASGSIAALPSGVPSLNDASHYYFTGRSDNFDPSQSSANAGNGRLDPEGVRVSKDGKSIFVSDEYGPYIYQFDRATGQRIKSFQLPSNLAVSNLSASGNTEIAGNTVGRIANKGMEGLAITPDGKTLVGIMQANLEQDAVGSLRIVMVDIASGATKEYAYQLSKGSGVSEIVALNDHQFLVDERDGKGLGDGSSAKVKQLYMIDTTGATDVSGLAAIGAATPSVNKSLFLDVVNVLKAHGYSADQIPSKIEGVAFGADVTIGGVVTHTLYLANDNDFNVATSGDNKFFVFGVTDADLAKAGATFVPQNIAAVPEPASYAMLALGLGLVGLVSRRKDSKRFKYPDQL